MSGDSLGLFDGSAVADEDGDSGCPEGVTASGCREAGTFGAPFDHTERVVAGQTLSSQAALSVKRSEEGSLLVLQIDACRFDVCIEILLGQMMGWNLMALAAFLVQADPPALALLVVVVNAHLHRGTDASEAVNHQTDDGPIAEPDDRGHVDGVQERPRFVCRQDGRLADSDDMLGAADRACGTHRHDLASDKPVKQHADGSKVLLDGWRRVDFAKVFDVC